ncbi:hypothetical protein TNIN_122661 [Trichonephila inaurata madagascariensis]|uniref:Uncharacterized protein n=1 Tax=Trichonephila inaurata madagascariensis TaxID=2747483 RepID=A0A8X6X1I5_9ARAC|nr:hypothetical protein TNIN_122661 [Trichonephila inaurata madagascariensis]
MNGYFAGGGKYRLRRVFFLDVTRAKLFYSVIRPASKRDYQEYSDPSFVQSGSVASPWSLHLAAFSDVMTTVAPSAGSSFMQCWHNRW